MTAVSDSIIFRNIFATPQSTAIWSDTRRTEYYLQFEKCLAEAQAELDIVRRASRSYVSAFLIQTDPAESM
jgi:3-carboxy-cis,cis-muconate cycloisomerase